MGGAVGAKLQARSQLPSAAGYIERRVRSLSEDIRVWEQQMRDGERGRRRAWSSLHRGMDGGKRGRGRRGARVHFEQRLG